MKEKEFKHILEKMKKEDKINFEVYYTLDEKENVIIDFESIEEEFKDKLKELKEILE